MASAENPVPDGTGRCEMDSHADTCLAGHGFTVIEETGDTCLVYPFSTTYKPLDIKIVNAVTAYIGPTGIVLILLFNNVLFIPDMEISLICPNHFRDPWHLNKLS